MLQKCSARWLNFAPTTRTRARSGSEMFGKPRQGVVANTLNSLRNGAVGFIDWLGLWQVISVARKQCPAAKHAKRKRENATGTHLDRVSLNAAGPNYGNDADSEKDHGAERKHRIVMNVFDGTHEV
jgi:hypothetical protein